MVNAKTWLDNNYPTKEIRKTITTLGISKENLEGELDLVDFIALKELIVNSKTETRSWESFYKWLNDNIVDINEKGYGKGNIKAAKRSEYPHLSGPQHNSMSILMNGLENYLKKSPINYSGAHHYKESYKYPILPYEDNKSFFQLANGQGNTFKGGFAYVLPTHQNILDDYEKLLANWKNATTNTTTTTSVLSIKINQKQTKSADIPITKKEWDDDYRKRPTQTKLDEAVKTEKDKYKDYIAPADLEAKAKVKGMVSKTDYDTVKIERDARPNITLTKEEWDNDYSKRPTKADNDDLKTQLDIYKNSQSDLTTIESILVDLRDKNKSLDISVIYKYKNALNGLENANKRNENLQSRLGTLEPQNRFLQEDIEKQKGEIANKDTQIKEFEDRITELNRRISELDSKFAELNKNAKENKYEIEDLESDRDKYIKRLERTKKELETMQKEKQELVDKLSILQEKLPASNLPAIIIPETERTEVKNFLQNYMKTTSNDYQDIINHPDFKGEKYIYFKQEEELKAEIIQIINKIDNWGK